MPFSDSEVAMASAEALRLSAGNNAILFDNDLRVQEVQTPLGTVRLTVRAIAQAEGFVFCRHRRATPVALTLEEWQALPMASETDYDV
ncbi:MAG: hypothetical protein AB7U34_00555 [Novosphingobium sp.]